MNPRRIARLLGLVVLVAVVIPFVIYAVPGVIGAEHTFVVLSGSMEPELSPGDAVVVDETDPSDIEEGDLITFARSGGDTVVTHRVIGVDERNGRPVFETKGDANDDADREPVPAENVVGSVTLTIPTIGHVVQFANSQFGFVTMVLLPLGLLAVTEAWSFARRVSAGAAGGDGSAASVRASRSRRSASDGSDVPASDGTSPLEWADRGTGADGDPEEQVTVDVTDLNVTLGLLAAATPYTVHVALRMQTVTTLAAAYATGFATLALGTLRAVTWYQVREARTSTDRRAASGTADPTSREGVEARGGHSVPGVPADPEGPTRSEEHEAVGAPEEQVVERMDESVPAPGPAGNGAGGGEENGANGESPAADDRGSSTGGSARTPSGVPSEPTPDPDRADDGAEPPREGDP